MDLPLSEFVGTVLMVSVLTRYIRYSTATEGLRLAWSARSAFVGKLLSCPHCISFWLALLCGLGLAAAGRLSLLWFGATVLVSWRLGARGGLFLHGALDRNRVTGASGAPADRACHGCGAPYTRDFLERRGYHFCSHRCWFDYLKARPVRAESRVKLFDKAGEPIRQEIYPGAFDSITPAAAAELLGGDGGYSYVDVRSVPEFENGHPDGAVNVPLYNRVSDGLIPNPDFLRVAEANFERASGLIIGCHSGSRARRAAEVLVAAGFTGIAHVDGGYGGVRDLSGRVLSRGWLQLGLPVEYGPGQNQNYQALGGTSVPSDE